MLESLRPFLNKILKPLAQKINLNPNIITLISPFIALLACYAFTQKMLLLATIAILLSGFLDILDGAVARTNNRSTKFGAFLDSTIDRISDGIIYIGIIFGGFCNWLIGVLLIHSAITISYVKARAESQAIKCDVGIAERAVRMIIIMIGSIIGYLTTPLYFTYILVFLVILSYFTVIQRVYHVWRALN